MIFPFVIELEQKIKATGDPESLLNVFIIIQTYLESKSVNDFYKTENTIKFKSRFFGINTNVFAVIDKGEFQLLNTKGEYSLKYRFYMLWFFFSATAMTVMFGLLSGQLMFTIVVFLALVIGNFLICFIRQKGVINKLVFNIDEAYRNEQTATVNNSLG